MRSRLRFVVLCALALAGCTPSIGDKCVLSTDCSVRGDRLCDTSQPNGYCTIFNCAPDQCPDKAACVLFEPEVPGCPYNDRVRSRTGRQFCMAQCHSNSDCRDGYTCADPRQPPFNALILDDDQTQRVCIVSKSVPPDESPDATSPVCGSQNPDSGFVPVVDAGDAGDAAGDAPSDASSDAPSDASGDGADAGIADAADSG
jgi:hypothetical protein